MSANHTAAECAARSAALRTAEHRIELDLSGAEDLRATTFRSRSTLRFEAVPGAEQTWVNLIAERVHHAELNGVALDLSGYDGATLPVRGLVQHNELVVDAQCWFSRTGEGLHRFTDPADDLTYLFTHCEPADARRIFACFDQPDLKSRVSMQITAPASWTVYSNGVQAERIELPGAQARTTFAATPPLSSYLVSLAAGRYWSAEDCWRVERPDGSTQEIPLRVMCRQSMRRYLDVDDIFTVTRQGLSFFDDAFGFPYPWGTYDQVFVPEYNLGAMENPGLVTFTESFLARGGGTREHRQQRACVIMHEMSHMWFGNLATMRWWDGLWLKESFADLMGYHACAAATQYTGAWVAFASGRKAWATRADQLPSTHPIIASVDDLEAASQNFDGITYSKGAAVIKQLMAYVGHDAFFAGVRTYLARHAFGTTEFPDLLACLEESSERSLDHWARQWLETAGISSLEPLVERDDSGTITSLSIRQHAVDRLTGAAALRPHQIRVGLYRLHQGRLQRTAVLDAAIEGAETVVAEAVGHPADLVLVNEDDLTFAKVGLDRVSRQTAAGHVSTMADPLARSLVWSSLWLDTRDALLPAHDFLEIALTQMAQEQSAALLSHLLGWVHHALRSYLPQEQRYRWTARVVGTCWAGLRSAEPGTDRQYVWATRLAEVAADSPAGTHPVRSLLEGTEVIDGLRIDDDLRWLLWIALAAQGQASPTELARALSQDYSMSGRTACVRARASRPTLSDKTAAWQRATAATDLPNDELRSLVAGFSTPSGADLTAPFAAEYFDSLERWWGERTQAMATITVQGLFPRPHLAPGESPEGSGAAQPGRVWLAEHADAPSALRRIVLEQQDDLVRALRAQDRGREVRSAPGLV